MPVLEQPPGAGYAEAAHLRSDRVQAVHPFYHPKKSCISAIHACLQPATARELRAPRPQGRRKLPVFNVAEFGKARALETAGGRFKMIRKHSLAVMAMLLFSAGSSIALAQNGARGNCPNPGQNCPRSNSGPCARSGGGSGAAAKAGPMAMKRGAGRCTGRMNCPRR